MAVLSNYGTYPDWSPVQGRRSSSRRSSTTSSVVWHDNTYVGPWSFMVGNVGQVLDQAAWTAQPTRQDAGSSFNSGPGC